MMAAARLLTYTATMPINNTTFYQKKRKKEDFHSRLGASFKYSQNGLI